jgi:hypothetical protein
MHIKFRTLPITLPLNATVKPGNIVVFPFPKVLSSDEKSKFLKIMQRLERFNNPVELIKEETLEP